MPARLYLKPLGLVWGETARAAAKAGAGGLLATSDTGFTGVEVIWRDAGRVTREQRRYDAIKASDEPEIRQRLAAIEAPRPGVAGLDFALPRVMGIVNVTPDSFSDGGLHARTDGAVAHGRALAAAGATILDVGGESTRPYSEPTPREEEIARAIPVVWALAADGARVSIDTRKPEVMRAAAEAGAAILNDVAALAHAPESLPTAVALGLPVVLMHAQGDPATMQDDPRYDDVCLDVFDWLEARIATCAAAGLPRERIVADPGIGFGKTHQHNLELLGSLALFHGLGVPLLVGASRKGFIGKLTGEPEAGRRVMGSIGAAVASVMQGVQILRVHDVPETVAALSVWHAAMVTQSMDLDGSFTRRVLGSYGP